MQKYGVINADGSLSLSSIKLPNYKPVVHEEAPDYDQLTQYVIQKEPVEKEDYIFIGVEVKEVEQDDVDGEFNDELLS